MLDLRSCDQQVITDAERLRAFAIALTQEIGMQRFGDPIVAHFGQNDPATTGYTLVQLIETSSITGHFCDLSGDAYLDIFSCQQFDPAAVRSYVSATLAPASLSATFVIRGP